MSNTKLKRISDKILYLPASHHTDRPVLAAVSGNKKTLIVDSGNSSEHAKLLLKELSNYKVPKPEFVAITHWHWDHIFGIYEMNLSTIAHIKTKTEIEKMVDYEWTDEALDKRVKEKIEIEFCSEMIKKEFGFNRDDIKIATPDILFKEKLILDLGGLTCIIENIGGDHSEDSSIVFIKEEKTIFLGDCLAPDLYCEKWKYSLDKLPLLLDKLESYDAEIYVSSHGDPVSKSEFKKEVDELRKVISVIEKTKNDKDKAITDLRKVFNRKLNDEDIEVIDYFINGLE